MSLHVLTQPAADPASRRRIRRSPSAAARAGGKPGARRLLDRARWRRYRELLGERTRDMWTGVWGSPACWRPVWGTARKRSRAAPRGSAATRTRPSFPGTRDRPRRSAALSGGRDRPAARASASPLPRRRPSSSSACCSGAGGSGGRGRSIFQRALEFQPDNARTYYYLADALNQAGDLPGARRALEQALSRNPGDTKAFHLMGRVLDRLNRPEEAREMYRRGRELGGL